MKQLGRYCKMHNINNCRAVMVTFAKNILEIAGDLLLCAGQRSGYEAAIHKFDTQRRNF